MVGGTPRYVAPEVNAAMARADALHNGEDDGSAPLEDIGAPADVFAAGVTILGLCMPYDGLGTLIQDPRCLQGVSPSQQERPRAEGEPEPLCEALRPLDAARALQLRALMDDEFYPRVKAAGHFAGLRRRRGRTGPCPGARASFTGG